MIYTVTEESGTKGLEQLAGSASTGTPLGTWASFETDYAPNIEWLQGGTTFNPNTYPALAMYLGGNTVPERFDHSRPSEWEDITLPTSQASAITMQYDGFITFTISGSMSTTIYINNVAFANNVNNTTTTPCYPFKKGDVIYSNRTYNLVKVKYYKHPLFIKATPTSADSDYEGTLNAIREFYVRNNTYSTEERLTGGYWIDGKPIYRRAFTGLTSISTSWTTIPDSTNNYRCIVSIDFAFSGTRTGYLQSRINNGHIEVSTNTAMSNIEGIYVEYTKTSD